MATKRGMSLLVYLGNTDVAVGELENHSLVTVSRVTNHQGDAIRTPDNKPAM